MTLVKDALQDVRDNVTDFHGKWFKETTDLAEELDVSPAKPRTCGRQTQRSNAPSESVEDYFKKTITIPLLDHILTEMNGRFGDLQVKASMGLHVIPALVETSDVSNFEFFMDDLPSVGTLQQELHMWRLKWRGNKEAPCDIKTSLEHCDVHLFPNISTIFAPSLTTRSTSQPATTEEEEVEEEVANKDMDEAESTTLTNKYK